MNLGWVAQSQLAVLRGGLLASEASLGILGAASEKRHAPHGQGVDTAPPPLISAHITVRIKAQ